MTQAHELGRLITPRRTISLSEVLGQVNDPGSDYNTPGPDVLSPTSIERRLFDNPGRTPRLLVNQRYISGTASPFFIRPNAAAIFDTFFVPDVPRERRGEITISIVPYSDGVRGNALVKAPVAQTNVRANTIEIHPDVIQARSKAAIKGVKTADKEIRKRRKGSIRLSSEELRLWNALKKTMPLDDPDFSKPEHMQKALTFIFYQHAKALIDKTPLSSLPIRAGMFGVWQGGTLGFMALSVAGLLLHKIGPVKTEDIRNFLFAVSEIGLTGVETNWAVQQIRKRIRNRFAQRAIDNATLPIFFQVLPNPNHIPEETNQPDEPESKFDRFIEFLSRFAPHV